MEGQNPKPRSTINGNKNRNRTRNANNNGTVSNNGVKLSDINVKIPNNRPPPISEMFEMFKRPTKRYASDNLKKNTIHFGAGMKLTMRYFPKHMQLVDKKKHMYAIYFQIIPYFNGVKLDDKSKKMFV
jgi:hypothetical protein